MPISLFPEKIGRRKFISTSLAASAGLALAIRESEAADSKNKKWAFVSDTHIPEDPQNEYRGFKPYDNYKLVAAQIKEFAPQGMVITGDVARLEGKPGDYANVVKLSAELRSVVPVHYCLGNHDDRDNLLAAAGDLPGKRQNVKGKLVHVVETNGVRFLMLDSLLYVNRVAGLLGKAQRTWLEEYLQNGDQRPILLFFHHTLSDDDGSLLDTDRLFSLVKPHKQVKAIVFGHSHSYNYGQESGIRLINLPATGYNFNDNEPVGWLEADVNPQGADFTLRAFGGSKALDGKTTSLEWRA